MLGYLGKASDEQQAYLEMLGSPKRGTTVSAPAPTPGLFPDFKGKAGSILLSATTAVLRGCS